MTMYPQPPTRRACPRLLAAPLALGLSLAACSQDALVPIEYGPPLAIEALLADDAILAGTTTTVTCLIRVGTNKRLANPEAYSTFVEPVAGLTIDGTTLGSTLAGTYEVRCGLLGPVSDVPQLHDLLTVAAAAPVAMSLSVTPDQRGFDVGEVALVRAHVWDQYGNDDRALASQVAWILPGSGLAPLDTEPGASSFYFTVEGEYPLRADLRPPLVLSPLSASLTLYCDVDPPALTLFAPQRGATLSGPDFNAGRLEVSGVATDSVSGLASLTVNGSSFDVGAGGVFIAELAPRHGLNHLAVVATDRAGRVSAAYSSIYYGLDYLAQGSSTAFIPGGLGVYLSQETLDDDARHCGFEGGSASLGGYRCSDTDGEPAYDDMATVVEVILNNLDLTALAAMEVYNSGPQPLTAELLGHWTFDIDAYTAGLAPYEVRGTFLLLGDYTVSARIASVELGQAVMGDAAQGILGLRATSGGLDLLAYIQPTDGSTDPEALGLTVFLEVRIDFNYRVVYSISKTYRADNGVWDVGEDPPEDVTSGACGALGAFYWIDYFVDLVNGSGMGSPNFYGYICNALPMAQTQPYTSTGVSAGFERARLAARLLFDATSEHLIDVTLQAHPSEPLLDFLGGDVTVETLDTITIDLTQLSVFNGVWVINLGTYQLANPASLLDGLLSVLLTELSDLLALALEDLIICDDPAGCPLGIDSQIERMYNSLTANGLPVGIPSLFDGDSIAVTITQGFDAIGFDQAGSVMSFGSQIVASRNLHQDIPEPAGSLARAGCGPAGVNAVDALTGNRAFEAAFDLDLANQALHAAWYNGGLSGSLAVDPGALTGALDALALQTRPLLPPVLTACAGGDGLQLQLGAMYLEFIATLDGLPVAAAAYSDLSLPVGFTAVDGRLRMQVLGAPLVNELEVLATLGALDAALPEVQAALAELAMPDLLTRFGDAVLAGIPVPTINLAAAGLPGVPADIEISFPISGAYADLDAAAIVEFAQP